MRILIVTSESLPGSEDRNLPLAAELTRRGHEVRHTGPARAMLKAGFSSTTFEPEFAKLPQAAAVNTELFDSWAGLRRMIGWAQVVLFSMAKGYKEAAEYAAGLSKVIIFLADTSLHPWIWRADLIAVGSPYERDRMGALIDDFQIVPSNSYIWPSLIPQHGIGPDRIILTGSTLLDKAAPQNRGLSEAEVHSRYGLDEKKRTAVWLPSSPACHDPWFKDLYRRVCAAVEEAGFNLIIKPHPRDYVGAKQLATYEDTLTPTWEQLAPGVRVCRAGDKWDCFRAADVLVSSWTTAAIEAALLKTPMLLVDPLPFTLEMIGLDHPRYKELLPGTRYSPPSRRTLGQMEPLIEVLKGRTDPRTEEYLEDCLKSETDFYLVGFPEYIGTESTMEELPRVLREGLYEFDDEEVFEDYAARYSAGLEGRAYLRIADAVESVESDPRLGPKLALAGSGLHCLRKRSSLALAGLVRRIVNRLGDRPATERR